MRAILTALSLMLALGPAAADEALTVDVSRDAIPVTSSFAGTDIVLFGTREEAGDIIAIVRGPPAEAVVRRKHRILGVWINTEERTYQGAPAYYAVAASRPLGDILAAEVLLREQIGLGNVQQAGPAGRVEPRREEEFRAALLRYQSWAGRYISAVAPVKFEGAHLFRANIALPASAPYGDYTVETLLVSDGKIAARRTVPLRVVEAGVNAGISDFARNDALAYGLIAVLAAAAAGWIASLAFRAY